MARKLVLGLALAALLVAPAMAQDRVSASEKGSLLVYNKVEIRWDANGSLIQDTFIDITNDYPADVLVQMYFVNGDEPLAEDPVTGERAHPGCNWVDNLIELTGDEPTFWSALTGLPKGVSPFTVLDPAGPGDLPGRPDPEGSDERVLRGFVIAWAVDAENIEIRWNHLKGDALIINYARATAWEYNAWAFATEIVPHGSRTGTPGVLNLDGVEYDYVFNMLLLDFYASGTSALSGGGAFVSVDTDLTLLPMIIDLRQDHEGPFWVKAKFDVWNMNEIKFSGAEKCIICFDQALLSTYPLPNHFLLENLQTAKGKARIDGVASTVCPDSISAPLLGVAAKYLDFNNGAAFAVAGTNLIGQGTEVGVIRYDVLVNPEEGRGQDAVEAAPVGMTGAPARRLVP